MATGTGDTARTGVDVGWGDAEHPADDRVVSLGEWSMRLCPTGIESIRLSAVPLLSRICYRVRGTDWSTEHVPVTFGGAGPVTFGADFPRHGLQLAGEIRLSGQDLEIASVASVSRGRSSAPASRIGPCVLISSLLAGSELRTAAGPRLVLPRHVARNPLVTAGKWLTIVLPGRTVTIELVEDGDWEVEDQRSWCDEGFKVYTPPLSAPHPEVVTDGRPLRHVLRVALAQPAASPPAPAASPGPSVMASGRATAPGTAASRTGGRLSAAQSAARVLPPTGLQHAGGVLPGPAIDALRDLRPAFVHLAADLTTAGWEHRLTADAVVASALGVPVVLTATADASDMAGLRRARRLGGEALQMLLVFDPGCPGTSAGLAAAARRAAGRQVMLGGGSRAHLAELLEPGAVPDDLDVVSVPLTACAHENDRAAVRAAASVYPAVLAAAHQVAGRRPLLVGPVGYQPAWDSWPVEPPTGYGWGAGSSRQPSVFTAAWAVAVLAAVAQAPPVAVLSLFHTTGSRGVGELGPGGSFAPFPVWTLLRELAMAPGAAGAGPAPGPALTAAGACGTLHVVAAMGPQSLPARSVPAGSLVLYAEGGTARLAPVRADRWDAWLPLPCVTFHRGSESGPDDAKAAG